MKIKLLILITLFSSLFICQKQEDEGFFPYKITGNRTLNLPDNYFAENMKGYAIVTVIIDDTCNLLNFAINIISIQNKKGNNAIKFEDDKVFDMIRKKEYELFTKVYYPSFLHDLYEQLKKTLNNLEFSYEEKKYLREVNTAMLKIYIN